MSELGVVRGYCRTVSCTAVDFPSASLSRRETPSWGGDARSTRMREGRGAAAAANSAHCLSSLSVSLWFSLLGLPDQC